ncbi:MAG TPA: CapA family protein [Polyangia bacterium]|jgi:Putative enzyme of poly-gamma-glutamate biosynthesis (capsule formation)|nr:CapA family protein [Polyangia bacterium]
MRGPLLTLAMLWTAPRAVAQPADEVNLVFAGDIMLDELPGEAIARGEDPFAAVASLLDGADLAVGNLECVVAEGGKAVDKQFTFRAHPLVLDVVARHFAAVSLANNHSADFGAAGLLQTMDRLRAARVQFFGAGKNLGEAHRPLMVERKRVRVALLGYNEFQPRWFEAGPSTPGVAWSEDEQILRDMKTARSAGAHIVIPVIHWGWEHETVPRPRQRELARALIDAGADAVIGGHPHVTQGAEIYRGKLILYSLGNLVFNGFDSQEANTGWLLNLTLDRRGVRHWHTTVVRLDERGLPRVDAVAASPCGDARSEKIRSCAVAAQGRSVAGQAHPGRAPAQRR